MTSLMDIELDANIPSMGGIRFCANICSGSIRENSCPNR
jgi:hypothetical protein